MRYELTPVIDICPLEELPPGEHKVVEWEDLEIGIFNCNGELLAIEDRCSHDDGYLIEGEVDQATCTVECPRHGSVFDLRTGKLRWTIHGGFEGTDTRFRFHFPHEGLQRGHLPRTQHVTQVGEEGLGDVGCQHEGSLVGVDRVPECGTNDEVLRAHGLDAGSLVARVRALTPA